MHARGNDALEATMLDYSFFKNYNLNLMYKSIRPGTKTGDPQVINLIVNYVGSVGCN